MEETPVKLNGKAHLFVIKFKICMIISSSAIQHGPIKITLLHVLFFIHNYRFMSIREHLQTFTNKPLPLSGCNKEQWWFEDHSMETSIISEGYYIMYLWALKRPIKLKYVYKNDNGLNWKTSTESGSGDYRDLLFL